MHCCCGTTHGRRSDRRTSVAHPPPPYGFEGLRADAVVRACDTSVVRPDGSVEIAVHLVEQDRHPHGDGSRRGPGIEIGVIAGPPNPGSLLPSFTDRAFGDESIESEDAP